MDKLREVSKDEFINNLLENEVDARTRKGEDPVADNIIKWHEEHDNQSYWFVQLSRQDFEYVVIPHHTHDSNGFPSVGVEGEPLWHVVGKYTNGIERPDVPGQHCAAKVRGMINGKVWISRISFVANHPDYAVRGHYKDSGRSFFYGGGYHRLVACGVWMKEADEYPPLELYFCEVS